MAWLAGRSLKSYDSDLTVTGRLCFLRWQTLAHQDVSPGPPWFPQFSGWQSPTYVFNTELHNGAEISLTNGAEVRWILLEKSFTHSSHTALRVPLDLSLSELSQSPGHHFTALAASFPTNCCISLVAEWRIHFTSPFSLNSANIYSGLTYFHYGKAKPSDRRCPRGLMRGMVIYSATWHFVWNNSQVIFYFNK